MAPFTTCKAGLRLSPLPDLSHPSDPAACDPGWAELADPSMAERPYGLREQPAELRDRLRLAVVLGEVDVNGSLSVGASTKPFSRRICDNEGRPSTEPNSSASTGCSLQTRMFGSGLVSVASSQSLARLNEPALVGEHEGLHPIAEPKLGEDVADVRAYCRFAEESFLAISAFESPAAMSFRTSSSLSSFCASSM
jgi:hypothetical protein